jgi:hypothetical protein
VDAASWFHAVNRGLLGATLFPTPDSAGVFVERIGDTAARFAVEVNAYCVMGTHYHLLVRADEAELRRALESLERDLVEQVGPPRLLRLALGRHFLRVTRYIHRNPVEAGLVRRPTDWPWSSCRGYVDRLQAPDWLRTDAVLAWLGCIGARGRYRRFVDAESDRDHGDLDEYA